MYRPAALLRTAKRIRQTEGLISLTKRTSAFVAGHFFQYTTYYLLERDLEDLPERSEGGFLPKIEDLTFRMVFSNREADELEAEGYEFRSYSVEAEKALDRGAVAFCFFVGRELANIGWVALTQEAKDSFNEPPMKMDFSQNEAYIAAVWTNPKYRRLGLRDYAGVKRRQFLLDRGVRTRRIAIVKGNIAFFLASSLTTSRAYAEGRYIRILCWKSWKETPMEPENLQKQRKRDVRTV